MTAMNGFDTETEVSVSKEETNGVSKAPTDGPFSEEVLTDEHVHSVRNHQDLDKYKEQQQQRQPLEQQEQQYHRHDRTPKKHWRQRPPYPDDDGFDENNAALEVVVNEWAQGTSIHGVPFVTDASAWKCWKRSVWTGLVLISTAFMVWQITQLIREYRDYEVITDTKTINPGYLSFPEVTLCTTNAWSQSRIEATGIQNPVNQEELELISTPREELLFATWFNGIPQDLTRWKQVILGDEFGRCWAFTPTKDEVVRRPGYYGGLRIWLDLRQDDYSAETNFSGAILWAEQPGTMVDSQLPLNSAKPGMETLINIHMVQFEREQQAPWARCQGEAPAYTQPRCRSECLMAFVRRVCHCRGHGDRSNQDTHLSYCQRTHDSQDYQCILKALANESNILENECSDSCSLPTCQHTEYRGSTVEVAFAKNWLNNFDYEAYNISKQYLMENFVSITVNFDKIEYELLTESKAVSFAQLLGSIGGSMGFFLGISLLSVFELVGDLGFMRLLPRRFGYRHLNGVGALKKNE